eukprot:3467445-Amphidinium_carterae.2
MGASLIHRLCRRTAMCSADDLLLHECLATLEPLHSLFKRLVRQYHAVTGDSALSLRSASCNHTQSTSERSVASMRPHIWSSPLASLPALASGATSQRSTRSILQQIAFQGDPGSVTALALASAFALALALAPTRVSAFHAARQHLCNAFVQRASVCPWFPAAAQQGFPARLSSAKRGHLSFLHQNGLPPCMLFKNPRSNQLWLPTWLASADKPDEHMTSSGEGSFLRPLTQRGKLLKCSAQLHQAMVPLPCFPTTNQGTDTELCTHTRNKNFAGLPAVLMRDT